ncbi:MAG TPA: hypothetical protein PLN21_03880 [Gemmatales bacterium]|nr:hypothetical protein [Gemmatales bacterium]
MYTLALVLHTRLTRQLIVYSKGMLRYCPDEKTVEEHLVAHGVKAEHAAKIVLAAQQRFIREQGGTLTNLQHTR